MSSATLGWPSLAGMSRRILVSATAAGAAGLVWGVLRIFARPLLWRSDVAACVLSSLLTGAAVYLMSRRYERLYGLARKEAERRRQANQMLQVFQRAINASSNGVVITDARLPSQPIAYVNPAFEKITGYSAAEVLGRNCRFMRSDERDQAAVRTLRAALNEGRDCTVVLRDFRKDGSLFYNELSISPVYGPGGEVTHFVGVQNDITHRRLAEEELQQAKEELESRVVERTLELSVANEQLRSELRRREQAEAEAKRTNAELFEAYETTLEGWAAALDLRDKETEGHSQRVTELTLRMAREMGFADDELVHVRRGALLHDIGKLGVPDAILLKPGKLTEDERRIMKRHPTLAYEWLAPISYLRPALDIPHCHHEKWDGSGYPRGLKGEQIPVAARLFAVVDVWDALISDRPYRQAWPREKTREHIRSLSGTHFDPHVVEVFLRMTEDLSAGACLPELELAAVSFVIRSLDFSDLDSSERARRQLQ